MIVIPKVGIGVSGVTLKMIVMRGIITTTGGQECANCYENSTTNCSYCRKKKLRDEDYTSPSIPAAYWTSCGFDEANVEAMESFLRQLKRTTLQLKSGEKMDCQMVTLTGGKGANEDDIQIRHDDILLPHWKEFTEALKGYKFDPDAHGECLFTITNVQLRPCRYWPCLRKLLSKLSSSRWRWSLPAHLLIVKMGSSFSVIMLRRMTSWNLYVGPTIQLTV